MEISRETAISGWTPCCVKGCGLERHHAGEHDFESIGAPTLTELMHAAALAPRRALAAAVAELRGTGALEEPEPHGWMPGEVAAVLLIAALDSAGFEIVVKALPLRSPAATTAARALPRGSHDLRELLGGPLRTRDPQRRGRLPRRACTVDARTSRRRGRNLFPSRRASGRLTSERESLPLRHARRPPCQASTLSPRAGT